MSTRQTCENGGKVVFRLVSHCGHKNTKKSNHKRLLYFFPHPIQPYTHRRHNSTTNVCPVMVFFNVSNNLLSNGFSTIQSLVTFAWSAITVTINPANNKEKASNSFTLTNSCRHHKYLYKKLHTYREKPGMKKQHPVLSSTLTKVSKKDNHLSPLTSQNTTKNCSQSP